MGKGLGCPDITLIEGICTILKISPEALFEVRLETAKNRGALLPVIRIRDEGGMDKKRFCIRCWPDCWKRERVYAI